MNCVFCEIPRDKIIFENKDFFVIKDHKPKAKIHLLLMPKKHIDNISELTVSKKSFDFLKEMKKIGSNLLTKLGCEKNLQVIGFHTPDYISVHHLHLHLLCKPFKNNSESKYLSHPEFAKLGKLIKYFT